MNAQVKAIRAEIERLKKDWMSLSPTYSEDISASAIVEEYDYLLSFIDSLPDEPTTEGLEEEIDNYIFHAFRNFRRDGKCAYVDMGDGKEWVPVEDWKITKRKMDKEQRIHFARHFAEWGAKQSSMA